MSSMSGTTRDAIDTEITGPDGRTFKLIDTAGIRRRTAVAGALPARLFERAAAPCLGLCGAAKMHALRLSNVSQFEEDGIL